MIGGYLSEMNRNIEKVRVRASADVGRAVMSRINVGRASGWRMVL